MDVPGTTVLKYNNDAEHRIYNHRRTHLCFCASCVGGRCARARAWARSSSAHISGDISQVGHKPRRGGVLPGSRTTLLSPAIQPPCPVTVREAQVT